MKIIYFTIVSFFFFGVAYAQPIFQPQQGGTGIGSATAGEVNNCLKVSDDSPFTYVLGACGSGGGTISNNYITKWATSTANADWIHTAGALRVGIGTTSPSQELSIQGGLLASGSTTVANLTATGTIYAGSGSLTSPSIAFQGDNDTGFYRTADNNFRAVANGTIIASFSNAGISTSIPFTASGGIEVDGVNIIMSAGGDIQLGAGSEILVGLDSNVFCNSTFTLACLYFDATNGRFEFKDTTGGGSAGFAAVQDVTSYVAGTLNTNFGVGTNTVRRLGDDSLMFAVQGRSFLGGTTTISGGLIATSTLIIQGSGTSTFAGDIDTRLLDVTGDIVHIGSRITFDAGGTATSTFGTAGIDLQGGGIKVDQGIVSTGLTSTSTFAQGINIANGCFALNDVCINSSIITGTGKVNQVAVFTSGNTIGGFNPFVYDGTLTRLGIGTTTPGQTLSVAGDAEITGTTTVNGLSATSSIQANVIISGNLFLGVRHSGTTTVLSQDLRVGTTTDAYGRAIRDNVYLAGRTVQGIPVFYEEFISSPTEPTTANNADAAGTYGMNFDADTDCQLGQQSSLSPWTRSKTGAIRLNAGVVAPDIGDGCILQGGARTIIVDANPVMEVRLQKVSGTNSMWGGFGFDTQTTNDRDAKATSTAEIIYLSYNLDGNWHAETCASSVCTTTNTGFLPSATAMHTLRIEATPTKVTFLIDTGTGVWQVMAEHTTNIPQSGMLFAITNELITAAAANGFWIDYVKVWLSP